MSAAPKKRQQQRRLEGGGDALWLQDPNVLVQSTDLFPVPRQTVQEQLNAVTRLLFLVSLGVFAFTRSIGTLLLGFLCALGLAGLYTSWLHPDADISSVFLPSHHHHQSADSGCCSGERCVRRPPNEGFVAAANDNADDDDDSSSTKNKDETAAASADELAYLASVKQAIQKKSIVVVEEKDDGTTTVATAVQQPTAVNPFGNLLQSDAMLRPGRLAAPTLTTPEARDAVYAAMEAQVRAQHPGEAARMFANSADQLRFRQSLRPFFTCASTTIIPDSNASWKSMVPNTAAWRDGACRPGSRFRPRYKVGAPKDAGGEAVAARTGVDSNFANTADTLSAAAATKSPK